MKNIWSWIRAIHGLTHTFGYILHRISSSAWAPSFNLMGGESNHTTLITFIPYMYCGFATAFCINYKIAHTKLATWLNRMCIYCAREQHIFRVLILNPNTQLGVYQSDSQTSILDIIYREFGIIHLCIICVVYFILRVSFYCKYSIRGSPCTY